MPYSSQQKLSSLGRHRETLQSVPYLPPPAWHRHSRWCPALLDDLVCLHGALTADFLHCVNRIFPRHYEYVHCTASFLFLPSWRKIILLQMVIYKNPIHSTAFCHSICILPPDSIFEFDDSPKSLGQYTLHNKDISTPKSVRFQNKSFRRSSCHYNDCIS